MIIIHLKPSGDRDNPIPSFTEDIMAAKISRKFKLPILAYEAVKVVPLEVTHTSPRVQDFQS